MAPAMERKQETIVSHCHHTRMRMIMGCVCTMHIAHTFDIFSISETFVHTLVNFLQYLQVVMSIVIVYVSVFSFTLSFAFTFFFGG